ncbi:MAG: pre-peptidase C-terminal domain-containing protein [Limnochordia bacterium]
MNRVNAVISIVAILILSLFLCTTIGFAQEYLPLDLGAPTTHHLSANSTSQWYAVSIPSPGELAVTLHCEGSLTATLYLYYGTSTLSSDSSGTSQTRRVERKDLYSGTYYVHVYRYNGEGAFTIEATHTPTPYTQDAEPNADAKDAVLIPIDQTTQGLLGYLMNNQVDARDWYKVTTTVPGSLTIDVQGEESLKFQAHLYDTNSTTSLYSDNTGSLSSRKLVRHDFLPGTYYLWLYRTAGYGGYSVQPVFTPQTYANDQEPNDAADSAQTIKENDSVDGLLGFYTSGKIDCLGLVQSRHHATGTVIHHHYRRRDTQLSGLLIRHK